MEKPPNYVRLGDDEEFAEHESKHFLLDPCPQTEASNFVFCQQISMSECCFSTNQSHGKDLLLQNYQSTTCRNQLFRTMSLWQGESCHYQSSTSMY